MTRGLSLTPKEEGLVPGRERGGFPCSVHPLPTWEQCLIGRQEEHVFEKPLPRQAPIISVK